MGINGNAWFEIGTADRAGAERFYGEVFGWTFGDDVSTAPDGQPYRLVSTGAGEGPSGGVAGQAGEPGYAIFYLVVEDTEAMCAKVEAAGGKVLVPTQTSPSGLTSAHVLDPEGNRFGLFTPPRG